MIVCHIGHECYSLSFNSQCYLSDLCLLISRKGRMVSTTIGKGALIRYVARWCACSPVPIFQEEEIDFVLGSSRIKKLRRLFKIKATP